MLPYLIKYGHSIAEARVAERVLKGMPSNEIAVELGITDKTVKFHLTKVYRKFNVKNRASYIILMYQKYFEEIKTRPAEAI